MAAFKKDHGSIGPLKRPHIRIQAGRRIDDITRQVHIFESRDKICRTAGVVLGIAKNDFVAHRSGLFVEAPGYVCKIGVGNMIHQHSDDPALAGDTGIGSWGHTQSGLNEEIKYLVNL